LKAIAPWIVRSIRVEIAAAIEALSSDTVVVDFTGAAGCMVVIGSRSRSTSGYDGRSKPTFSRAKDHAPRAQHPTRQSRRIESDLD
jgi:hypothetical protein